MDGLSIGFLEALENDLEHALEGLHRQRHTEGLEGQDRSLAPLTDWHEIMRGKSQPPAVPSSDFRIPRSSSSKTPLVQELIRASSLERSVESITSSELRTNKAKKKKKNGPPVCGRQYDLSSFGVQTWSLSKGWKNRPRPKLVDDKVMEEDIIKFKRRYESAREKGDNKKGFRFGYHGDEAKRGHTTPSAASLSASREMFSSSSSLTLTRSAVLNTSSTASSLAGGEVSMAGAGKIKAIQFLVEHDHKSIGPRFLYNEQEILAGTRQSTPVGNRTLPNGSPILVPRSGSPLERVKTVTFGSCRRFPTDPFLKSPSRSLSPNF